MVDTELMFSYEFHANEFVTALECVQLETQSTESGMKEFIVVGTTVNRGEDLAVKGVVSDHHLHSRHSPIEA